MKIMKNPWFFQNGFYGYVWSGMKGSEWGGQEINARNEELSMSRRAQYILESPNSKNP